MITGSEIDQAPRRGFQHNWIVLFDALYGVFIALPFLAPVLMDIGWKGAANILYFLYSFLCHQLPERSFFLFGSRFMYSLPEIQSAWYRTADPMILRQFTGNSSMGWKVAWSDRMVSMYSSVWVFGLLWYPLRHRLPRLPFWGFVLFLIPMALDGTTHLVSDLAGLEQGFRETNLWLAMLTHNALPAAFYSGNTWGSFNSIMRLLTGIFFGMGIVWFGFPHVEATFGNVRPLHS